MSEGSQFTNGSYENRKWLIGLDQRVTRLETRLERNANIDERLAVIEARYLAEKERRSSLSIRMGFLVSFLTAFGVFIAQFIAIHFGLM